MEAQWPHTGAILVGGHSSRMGRPKHLLTLADGRTMLEHVEAALSCVCRSVVYIGTAPDVDSTRTVPDFRADFGPLAGVEALLKSQMDDHYLVCPCDIPLVSVALLRGLTIDTDAMFTAVQFEDENSPRTLPLRIAAAAGSIVDEQLLRGERAIRSLLGREDATVEIIHAQPGWRTTLTNINTPDDLANL